MRYFIEGVHPESDSSWLEYEAENLMDIEIVYNLLPEIDGGNGHYIIWDTKTDKEVHLSDDKEKL